MILQYSKINKFSYFHFIFLQHLRKKNMKQNLLCSLLFYVKEKKKVNSFVTVMHIFIFLKEVKTR